MVCVHTTQVIAKDKYVYCFNYKICKFDNKAKTFPIFKTFNLSIRKKIKS